MEWNLVYKISLSGVTSTTLIAEVWCNCVKKDPVYWEGGRGRKKKKGEGDREPGSVIDDLPDFFEVDEFLGKPLRATSPEAYLY